MSKSPEANPRGPRKLKSKRVLEKIRDYIIEHRLQVGDRIPTEHELADDLQVSRVCVREATKALSLVGVLEASPKRGTVLGEADISGLSDIVGFHFACSNYTIKELVEARLIVEVGQLKHAMANITEDSYREMLDIAEKANVVGRDRQEWLALDLSFHNGLLKLGNNRAIFAVAGLLRQFFHVVSKERGWDKHIVSNEHAMIVEALYRKNLPLAEGLMHQHLMRRLEQSASTHDKREQNKPPGSAGRSVQV